MTQSNNKNEYKISDENEWYRVDYTNKLQWCILCNWLA